MGKRRQQRESAYALGRDDARKGLPYRYKRKYWKYNYQNLYAKGYYDWLNRNKKPKSVWFKLASFAKQKIRRSLKWVLKLLPK